MIDWIKVVKGAAMVLPGFAFMFVIAWLDAKRLGVPFFAYALNTLGLVGGVLLLFSLAILAGSGVVMVLEAFR